MSQLRWVVVEPVLHVVSLNNNVLDIIGFTPEQSSLNDLTRTQ